MESKKILFVIPSLANGGAERVVSRISSALANKDHDVSILTFYKTDKDYLVDEKIKVVNLSNGDFEDYKKIGTFKRLRLIKKVIKNINPDAIFPFLDHVFIYVMLSIFFRKYRKSTSFLIRANLDYQSKKIRFLLKLLLPFTKQIIVQNEGQKQSLTKKQQKKTVIIPNPVEDTYLNFDKKFADEPKYIVSIGRLENQKNYQLALNAFANVSKKYDNLKYFIYGKGSLQKELLDLCEKLDITDKVEFKGFVSSKEEIYSKCDIYLMSSRFEGMPNALAESLSVGIPSISTNCKFGPKDLIIDSKIGILLEDESIQTMENAINEMIKKYSNYASFSSYRREVMKNKYSIDKIVDLWCKTL